MLSFFVIIIFKLVLYFIVNRKEGRRERERGGKGWRNEGNFTEE